MYGGGVGPAGVSADVFLLDDDAWRHLAIAQPAREHLAAARRRRVRSRSWADAWRLTGNLGTVDLVSAEGVVGRTEDLPTARGGIAAFSAGGSGTAWSAARVPTARSRRSSASASTETTTLPGLTVPRHGLGAVVLGGAGVRAARWAHGPA